MIRYPWRRVFQPGPGKPRAEGSPSDAHPSNGGDASSAEPDPSCAGTVRGERTAFIVGGR